MMIFKFFFQSSTKLSLICKQLELPNAAGSSLKSASFGLGSAHLVFGLRREGLQPLSIFVIVCVGEIHPLCLS